MSTNPVRKRRHVDIIAPQKKELCEYKKTHPKATQAYADHNPLVLSVIADIQAISQTNSVEKSMSDS